VVVPRRITHPSARELKAHGAMTALLKTALAPNLVQTLENNRPSSTWTVRQHRARLQSVIADTHRAEAGRYVVTEPGRCRLRGEVPISKCARASGPGPVNSWHRAALKYTAAVERSPTSR